MMPDERHAERQLCARVMNLPGRHEVGFDHDLAGASEAILARSRDEEVLGCGRQGEGPVGSAVDRHQWLHRDHNPCELNLPVDTPVGVEIRDSYKQCLADELREVRDRLTNILALAVDAKLAYQHCRIRLSSRSA